MTGPGSSLTRSHSSSGVQSGVKPVVADSGSTTSSAPVASTQRVSQSTHFSTLALTASGDSGPATGAIWTAAAVNARMSVPPGDDADGHAGEGDHGTDDGAHEELPALEPGPGRCRRGIHGPGRCGGRTRRADDGGLGARPGGHRHLDADPGDVVVDGGEELAGHLLGDAGEHALADAADGAADDGVG